VEIIKLAIARFPPHGELIASAVGMLAARICSLPVSLDYPANLVPLAAGRKKFVDDPLPIAWIRLSPYSARHTSRNGEPREAALSV
jgi:hypothetical protein